MRNKSVEERRVINRSLSYVLPMLDWWSKDFLINEQFVGCFIGDVSCPDLDNNIFVLYRFSGNRSYLNFETVLRESEYYENSYEPDKYHTMFIFKVPAHHQINYELFKESRYSKLSEEYKQRMLDFYDRSESLEAVLYKHESKYQEWEEELNKGLPRSRWTRIPRDMEASSAINLDEEYFSDKFKIKEAFNDIKNNKSYLEDE